MAERPEKAETRVERRQADGASLVHVERRRRELLAITLFVLVAFAGGMVLVSFASPSADTIARSLPAVRIGVLVLAFAFAAYVVEKERSLRKLNRSLLSERGRSSELAQRLDEIELLERAGAVLTSSADLGEMLEVVLGSASELLDADGGSILLRHDDCHVVAAVTGSSTLVTGQRRPIDDDQLGSGVVPAEADTGASLTVPLEADGEVLGVITVEGRSFQEYDVRRIKLFAQHAAIAIRDERRRRTESLSAPLDPRLDDTDVAPVVELHSAEAKRASY